MKLNIGLLNRNHNKLRLIFIIFLFTECIFFNYFFHAEGYGEIWDISWYINSGQKLISGESTIKNYICSPVFSIIANFVYKNDNNYFNYIFNIFHYLFIFSASYFISLLIEFKKFNSELNIYKDQLLAIIFITFNPYIIKYLNPVYSDFFSIIAGILFSLRYIYIPTSISEKFKIKFIENVILTKKYYLIIFLCVLTRYPVVILLTASLVLDSYKQFEKYNNLLLVKILKYLIYLFSVIFILLLTNNYVQQLQLGTYTIFPLEHIYENYHPDYVFNTNIINVLFTFVIATLGFREAFSWWSYDPSFLVNPEKLSNLFEFRGFQFSETEIKISILIGIILLVISIYSILKLYIFKHNLFISFMTALYFLISAELIIGHAHYRYMLLLLPSIIVGLSLNLKYKH